MYALIVVTAAPARTAAPPLAGSGGMYTYSFLHESHCNNSYIVCDTELAFLFNVDLIRT